MPSASRAPAADGRQGNVDRQRIRAAAARLFRERGYHGTSIRDIAEEVGILSGSLYHHIDSKQDLLVEILQDSVDTLYLSAEAAVEGSGDARARLRALVTTTFRHMASRRDEMSVFLMERRRLPEVLTGVRERARAFDLLALQVVQQGIEEGAWAPSDPRLATLALLGMIASAAAWYDPQGRLTADAVAEAFAGYAERMLGGTADRLA